MLNHSHSRPDSRCSPLLHHGHVHAAAAADTDHRAAQQQGMDPPSSSGRTTPTTPRRQLQGPRPPRLNVRMESHAIKKHPSGSSSGVAPPGEPAAPAGQGQGRRQDHHHHHNPGRAPVIIYDASPKVIHAKPSEFMALVQRLTGPGSGGSGTTPPPPPADAHMLADDDDGDAALLGQAFLPPELLLSPSAAMSPAARLATIERSVRGPMPSAPAATATEYDVNAQTTDDHDGTLAAVLGPARHLSILSPLPSSLPPAAASGLFSPLPFDASTISWLNELSPILRAAASATANASGGASSSGAFGAFGPGGGGTSNGGGGSRPPPPAYYSDPFVPSPRNLLATPTVPSPATCAEFFGSLPDL